MRLKKLFVFNEFTVVGVFVAVVFVGLLAVLVSLIWTSTPLIRDVAPEITAPTLIEYRTEARSVLLPFLNQVISIDSENLPEDARGALVDLVGATQERLLRMRVPGSEREAHLSFVILLDQWTAALAGPPSAIEGVLDRTAATFQQHRWISPTE